MKKKTLILFLLLSTISKLSAQLVLNEAFFEPDNTAGLNTDTNGDGIVSNESDDEFIEFVNASSNALDISGYQISDETALRHIVPASTILQAGELYVVFGGGDVSAINNINGVIAHTASTGALSLTDGGDVITVEDTSSNTIITFDSDGLFLNLTLDYTSAERSPSIIGEFNHHYAIDGTAFSPGVLSTSTFNNTTSLVINEINFDPGVTNGDANGDGTISTSEDEFIEIYNNSDAAFDISGYTFSDMTSFRLDSPDHTVPSNTIIPANGVYLLFGGGTPTGDFGANTIVQTSNGTSSLRLGLTNTGDALFVKDASGNVVLVFDSAGIDAGNNQSITRTADITGHYVEHGNTYLQLNYSPGKKSNEDELVLVTPNYTVGQSYFGANDYIEYIPGDLPIIIVAPHGGPLKPFALSQSDTDRANDSGTFETTHLLNTYLNTKTNGGTPHIIINNLHASYLNAARDIDGAAGTQTALRDAYKEFHNYIEDAKTKVTQEWGTGHYIEIHGNGVTETAWNMIGVGVEPNSLRGTDEDVLGEFNVSSLKSVVNNNNADFLELVRGRNSFGGMLEVKGWKSAPTPINLPIDGVTFFFSGYNIHKHGSRYGGTIDATHLESYYDFMQSDKREDYTDAIAESLLLFMNLHYGFDLKTNRFPLSISDEISQQLDQIVIYPNPSTSENGFSIKGINESHIENIILFNTTGSEILKLEKNFNNPVNNLSQGIFFVRINLKNGHGTTKKIIIK